MMIERAIDWNRVSGAGELRLGNSRNASVQDDLSAAAPHHLAASLNPAYVNDSLHQEGATAPPTCESEARWYARADAALEEQPSGFQPNNRARRGWRQSK